MENLFRLPLVSCISELDRDVLHREFVQAGYVVYHLDGAKIHDEKSFFAEAYRVLPFDPPASIVRYPNWDSFEDALIGGIALLGATKVAIIWSDVEKMFDHGLKDLLEAYDCFLGMARAAYDPEVGISPPVAFAIVLTGFGRSFIRVADLGALEL
jgi:hypothetical protein